MDKGNKQPEGVGAQSASDAWDKVFSAIKAPNRITVIIVAVVALLAGGGIGATIAYPQGHRQAIADSVTAENLKLDARYKSLSKQVQDKQIELNDANGTIAEADTVKSGIDDLNKQHDILSKQVQDAQAELTALNGQIDQAKGKPIQLPAGTFTVGKEIPEGRYVISGSSNFIVNNGGKINTILGNSEIGSGDYHGDLAKGDTVENHAPATLTPAG